MKNSGRVLSPPEARINTTIERRADFSAMLALLREMNARLERIELRLSTRRVSRDDYSILMKLLPAVGGRIGSDYFTTAQLLADPVFKALLEELNARQVGKLLRRSVDVDVDGLCVQHVTSEHNACLWQVVSVIKLPNSPSVFRSS
jgi:hypothetical protein